MRKVLASLLAVSALALPSTAVAHSDHPGEGWFEFKGTVVPGKEGMRVDPLVFPGTTNVSHEHQFACNKSINENSTNASLRANPDTTCLDDVEEKQPASVRKYANAIWYPRFYQNGVPLTATRVTTAYAVSPPATVRDFASIQPFTDDLNFIAGSSAGGPQQVNGQYVYKIVCPGGVVTPGTATVAPLCATAETRVTIFSPDCWDGVNSSSANHKSHLTYSRKLVGATLNTCPATHPVLVPAHRLTIELPVSGGSGLTVATGSGANAHTNGNMSTLHLDYMSAIVPDADGSSTRSNRTRDCLNENEYCGGTPFPVPGEGGGI